MIDSLVTTSEKDAVLFVTLNRPERRNPLSSDMIAALSAAIESGNEDASTRVIVIRAVGLAFSAGHDLRETRRRDNEDDTAWQARIDALLQDCAALMTSILRAPKPIIASVQGGRQRRRLPTGLCLRSGYCLRGRYLLHTGSQYRYLLHHAISRYRSESLEKARTGNGTHRGSV